MPADLSQLKDIHLPPAVTEFPIAYGWWLLVIITLIIIVVSLIAIKRYRLKNATKKAALNLLDLEYKQYKINKDHGVFLQKTNQILKRYCLEKYPHAIGLSGLPWIDFLIRHGQQSFFNAELAHALSQGIYQQSCDYNPDDLFIACSNWLKHNKALDTQPTTHTASNKHD